MPSMLIRCPDCKATFNDPQYVPALYDLQRAADLIPMSYKSLIRYLSKHKEQFKPLYRTYRERGMWRWCRLLNGYEINQIREQILTPSRSRRKGLNDISH